MNWSNKPRRLVLLFLILAACQPGCRAQEPADSAIILFHVEDLYYHSVFEYQVFDELEDGNRDYLSLISCINPGTTEQQMDAYRRWIAKISASIGVDRFGRSGEGKKIEAISNYLSGNIFVQYDQMATFDDLYRTGRYNYILSACLYAFVMDELNIPYIIRESSSHLYLLAWPLTEKIIIETTIPEYRHFMFDYNARVDFVKYLRENNVIDEFTWRSKPTRELFEKYFFPQKDITLKEISGLQYMYKAMEDINNQAFKSAYLKLQKAYYLYPSYKVQYLLLAGYYSFMDSSDFTDTRGLVFLAAGPGLIPIGFNFGYYLQRFAVITETYLFDREDISEYNRIYRFLSEEINDTTLRDELSFFYYYETGRYCYNSGRFELALDNIEKARDIKPTDKDLQVLLVSALAGYAATTGPSELIPRLEYYDEEFTIEERYDIFTMVKMQAFLRYADESFQLQDVTTGETYLSKFEALFQNNPDIGIDRDLIGSAYSSAAVYYYRNGAADRSRQMIMQGLQYAPDNIELMLKLESFKE
jgi:tetratricopeptide (TPR) repeat protein